MLITVNLHFEAYLYNGRNLRLDSEENCIVESLGLYYLVRKVTEDLTKPEKDRLDGAGIDLDKIDILRIPGLRGKIEFMKGSPSPESKL